MARKPIMIKPENKGTFTKKAKAAGKTVPAFAAQVTAPGSKATKATKKQAVFAENAAGWKKGK